MSRLPLSSSSGCIDIPQLDSKIEFGSLKRALAVAGIAPPEQQLIFTLIAALLHLGNMAYYFADDAGTCVLRDGSTIAHHSQPNFFNQQCLCSSKQEKR